ncbi:MAG TPA: hypothetical protein IAB87_05390 [Candidatus Coprenecus merdipullorum]|nr:hypothetical protein [Candidatus Coprenecus merdipullorum]
MKTNILNLAAAALLIFAASSCNKEQIVNTGDGTKAVVLNLSFGDAGTKAFTPDESYKPNYKDFSKLDIYFTNASGKIIYYWNANETDVEGDGKTIWDGLVGSDNADGPGVKFLGLSADVTAVYVVANGPDLEIADNGMQDTPADIKDLNSKMLLTSYSHEKTQIEMPYAGGDIALESITDGIKENAREVTVGGDSESGMYVKAEIKLRPAISRIEVEKVGAQVSGTDYFIVEDDGSLEKSATQPTNGEEYYSVSWTNFDITLVGVYMSDVYRHAPLFPASNSIEAWNADDNIFETPEFEDGQSPISSGAWTSLTGESTFNDAIAHSNWEDSYKDMVPAGYEGETEGENNWLFTNENTDNNGVIPFNFFVPYNVTDDAVEDETVTPIEYTEYPKLHFQFIKGDGYDDGFAITQVKHHSKGNEKVLSKGDPFYESLTHEYLWQTALGDNTSYANVVGFVTDKNHSKENAITLQPGYIYRLKEVLVNPTNLSAAPSESDIYNIYVVVDVVPFQEQNVFPVFE